MATLGIGDLKRGEDGRKRAATALAPRAKWENVVLFKKNVPCSSASGERSRDGTSTIRVHWLAARAARPLIGGKVLHFVHGWA